MLLGKLRILVLLLNSILISIYSIAQESQTNPAPTHHHTHSHGKIVGKVIDKNTGEPLIGAIVQIPSINKGAQTDLDGKFSLRVPVGTYDITIKYISYTSQNFSNITVTHAVHTELNASLEEETKETKEVVIKAKVEKESNNFIMIERKNASQVSDGISSESFKKTPDRSTADVLKRVTGASIQDGKFAVIRGMNDRYNAGYLNDAPLPSTESDRKAFSFDVIPANLIDNIQILKAGTPDVSGDFAGGVIQIRTKNIPTEFTQSISLGGQYNSLSTFKENVRFTDNRLSALGTVSNNRNLPDVPLLTIANSTNITNTEKDILLPNSQKFNQNWSSEKFKAVPNLRFNYSIGLPTKIAGKELGILASINYNSTRTFTKASLYDYNQAYSNTENFLDRNVTDNSYKQNITSGGILNLTYKLSPLHIISIRNFYNINSDETTVLRNGVFKLSEDPAGYVKSIANWINYGRILNNQLQGEHSFGENPTIVKWYLNNSNIVRSTPDYKMVNYTAQSDDPTTYYIPSSDFFRTSSGRFYSDMNENLTNGEVNIKKALNFELIKTEVKAGLFFQNRNRAFNSRTFIYFNNLPNISTDPTIDLSSNNIKKDDGLLMVEKTNSTDRYNASSKLYASYLMLDQKFKRLKFLYGIRVESFSQDVEAIDLKGNVSVNSKFVPEVKLLPSINLTYSLTDKSNLRAAFYQTVNRPEFRELAKFAFYRFDIDSDQLGFDSLKTADISNIDLRYEFFPRAGQVLSVGTFMKNVKNPIENKLDVSQPTRTFVYANEKNAKVYGVEFEFRKSLEFISSVNILKNTTAYANLSLIKSTVSFKNVKIKQTRSLQGQSPYILNCGLNYNDEESGLSVSAAINRTGKRIAYVGDYTQNFRGDVYELPRTVIDLQIAKKIGKFDIKATVGDLLAQDLVFRQYNDIPVKVESDFFRYKMPWTFTLAAGLQF